MDDMPHYDLELITTGYDRENEVVCLVTDMGGLFISKFQAQQLRNHLVEFLGDDPIVYPPEPTPAPEPHLKLIK